MADRRIHQDRLQREQKAALKATIKRLAAHAHAHPVQQDQARGHNIRDGGQARAGCADAAQRRGAEGDGGGKVEKGGTSGASTSGRGNGNNGNGAPTKLAMSPRGDVKTLLDVALVLVDSGAADLSTARVRVCLCVCVHVHVCMCVCVHAICACACGVWSTSGAVPACVCVVRCRTPG